MFLCFIFYGGVFLCLPPYISNHQSFETKPLVPRSSNLRDSTYSAVRLKVFESHWSANSSFKFKSLCKVPLAVTSIGILDYNKRIRRRKIVLRTQDK